MATRLARVRASLVPSSALGPGPDFRESDFETREQRRADRVGRATFGCEAIGRAVELEELRVLRGRVENPVVRNAEARVERCFRRPVLTDRGRREDLDRQ